MRGRPRLGSSSKLQVSGFISCLAPTNVLHDGRLPSLPWSDAADARGICALQPGQFRQAAIGIFELLQVSGFLSCLDVSMIAFSFPCPTLQTHVEGAPFNLDSSGFRMVFSCSTVCLGSPRS